jgi:NADH-quinone oxidoreductase subunit M
VTNPANEHLSDLNAREFATLVPLVVLAFWIGVYPKPFFRYLDLPVKQIVERVNPGYYTRTADTKKVWVEIRPAAEAASQPAASKPAPEKSASAKAERK